MINREETSELILDAVSRLIQRYGYRKMTVDDIASEAGIGKGTIYLYFPSKEEIALSWIDRSSRRLQERLQEIADGDGTPLYRLRSMLIDRVMFRFDSAQNLVHSLDELFVSIRGSILQRRVKNHGDEAKVIAQVVEEGQRLGNFQQGDPLIMAQAMLNATNSMLPYSLSTEQLGQREEVNEKTEIVVDLLLTGLRVRS